MEISLAIRIPQLVLSFNNNHNSILAPTKLHKDDVNTLIHMYNFSTLKGGR